MREFICSVCGYVYSEARGIPEAGITPGTRWEALPDDWVCPLCGATKAEFTQRGADAKKPKPHAAIAKTADDMRGLSALQISALCGNLARGCEKQYKAEEATQFSKLADYFKSTATTTSEPSTGKLLELVEKDLNEGIPVASEIALQFSDRGALRALVWSEKVSKILKSLLARYERDGDAMLENTSVYVCVICGFVYVGDTPPALCPVCKAPSWKLERIEGRAS